MKNNLANVINLAYPDKSDIQFKIIKFPDGQQQVTILDDVKVIQKEGLSSIINLTKKVIIKTRLNDFKDLELICCTVASLKEKGINNIDLYVPYFLGSRSDRKFEEGSNNYLKTVICPIINSLGFSKVIVLDPHSDVLEACLTNFEKSDNIDLVNFVLNDKKVNTINAYKNKTKHVNEDCIIISPDAGANKKIYKLSEKIGYTNKVITCSKYRDENGKLSNTEVPLDWKEIYSGKDFIIIDDISDGGGTFINIAKEIVRLQDNHSQLRASRGKIYLIVTHGIFSKGFDELNKYFERIYCTNSYSDIPDYYSNGMKDFKTNVKQLNVF